MIADLHIHSYYSDGTQSPKEIADEAMQKGIGLIAVCDHNSIKSFPEVRAACAERNIGCIKGVEVDCLYGDLNLHVLAYNCNLTDTNLNKLLDSNYDIMEQMSVDLIGRMAFDYSEISAKEYRVFERKPENGGWKGIDYLRSKGFKISYPECMAYYRNYGIGGTNKFQDIDMVCSIIHNAGGAAVLAHPGDRLKSEPGAFMNSLGEIKELGIDGIECYYPSHSEETTNICLEFCKKNNLLITAGSDSHGGFASFVKGVRYDMGVIKVDTDCLNLDGLI